MKEKDINHLEWIFDRMVYVHNENKNFDYMTKFREIIEQLCKDNSRKQSKQCAHEYKVDDKSDIPFDLICQKCGKTA